MDAIVEQQIHSTSRRRAAEWASFPACDPAEVSTLTRRLEELYAQKRLERAQRRHGDAGEIRRRARIEREIERLMSENN